MLVYIENTSIIKRTQPLYYILQKGLVYAYKKMKIGCHFCSAHCLKIMCIRIAFHRFRYTFISFKIRVMTIYKKQKINFSKRHNFSNNIVKSTDLVLCSYVPCVANIINIIISLKLFILVIWGLCWSCLLQCHSVFNSWFSFASISLFQLCCLTPRNLQGLVVQN